MVYGRRENINMQMYLLIFFCVNVVVCRILHFIALCVKS